jgi:ribosome recycling factor
VFVQRSNTLNGDAVPEEINAVGGENAILRVDLQAITMQQRKKLVKVLVVLLQSAAGEQMVIQVNEQKC